MDTNAVLEAIRRRRTVRRFTDEPVGDEQIHKLLVAAMSAPSKLNRRPWHFIVIREEQAKHHIAETLRLHPHVAEAPVLLAIAADTSASPDWRLDVTAAVENLMIAAAGYGLGTAWIGAPDSALQLANDKELREILNLPGELTLFSFVAVGRPAELPAPHAVDPYFAATRVHYEHWGAPKVRTKLPSPDSAGQVSPAPASPGSGDAVLEGILRRRTVRRFTSEPVDDSLVEGLLESAMRAPTRLGSRPWHFFVIRKPEAKQRLLTLLQADPSLAEAPAFVLVAAERDRSVEWDLDAAAATENLLLAAASVGLGSTWIASNLASVLDRGGTTFREIVRAPEYFGLVSLVALGYAQEPQDPHKPEDVYMQDRAHFGKWGGTRGE